MTDRGNSDSPDHGSPRDLEPLATFSLSLIKAMMQAGFYEPGHPEADKALATLYDEFRAALDDRSELTYMAKATGAGDSTVVIQGYQMQPLPLEEVMSAGMAEMFAPKFLEFFDRRNLLSFSIKSDLAPEEFSDFVGLMSQPPSGKLTPAEERDRITQEFVDRHIVHISTVFHDDVVGKERKLPWWVEVSLSRLSRDLRVLPLYRHASEDDIHRIKVQILDDVIRPVQTPELLKDFLINCDLVTEVIDLEETALERLIVGRIVIDRLPGTARALIEEVERLGGVAEEHRDAAARVTERCLDVLREIIERLRREGHEIDYDLVESLVDRGLLQPDELPRDLQDAMQNRILADEFVGRVDEHVATLREAATAAEAEELIDLLPRVFPEVVRRGDYAAAAKVIRALANRRRVPEFAELESDLRDSIADETMVAHLVDYLEFEDKERRHYLIDVLAFVGEPAGAGLLQAYAASSSKSVRSSAFEAMRVIGGSTLERFVERLPEIEKEWAGIRHALTVLGDEGDASLAGPIAGLAQHDNLHVREATLATLLKLQGAAAEPHFLRALEDPEAGVRAVAVACLGEVRSDHRATWDFYAAAFGDAEHDPEDEAVLVKVCQALAHLEDGPSQGFGEAEAILLEALRPAQAKGVLSRLKKASPRYSPPVLAAVCDALTAVGSLDAVEPLRQLADGAPEVTERAAAAADLIERQHAETGSAVR